MKNIQLAMIVLLLCSLCVQAYNHEQQTLDTMDAWHIREQKEQHTDKEIINLDLLPETYGYLRNHSAAGPDRDLTDSLFQKLNLRIPDYSGIRDNSELFITDKSREKYPYGEIPGSIQNFHLKRLMEIAPDQANLSEINWQSIMDRFEERISNKGSWSDITGEVGMIRSNTEKIEAMTDPGTVKRYISENMKKAVMKEVESGNKKITRLKKIFPKVNDNRYMMTDEYKKGEARSYLKKIHIGGSIQARRSNPAILGFTPECEITPVRFLGIGIGFNYSISARVNETQFEISEQWPACILYSDIELGRVFIRGSYQTCISKSIHVSENTSGSETYSVGIGKDFTIGNGLKGETVLLYRCHQEGEFNSSPWLFQMGFKRALIR